MVLALILVAIFGDVLAPYPFDETNLRALLQPPSVEHPMGTDQLGRDYLSRNIHGARISMFVGLLATSLNVLVAVLIGGTAGFFGGKLDLVVQRVVDAWMAFPGLLLLLTIMSLVGQSLLQLILVLGVSGGVVASRLVRGAVIAVKENDYLQAATATGSTRLAALVRHVLPNVAAPIIVVFSINIGAVIISEASMSFLGFGLPVEIPSWGRC